MLKCSKTRLTFVKRMLQCLLPGLTCWHVSKCFFYNSAKHYALVFVALNAVSYWNHVSPKPPCLLAWLVLWHYKGVTYWITCSNTLFCKNGKKKIRGSMYFNVYKNRRLDYILKRQSIWFGKLTSYASHFCIYPLTFSSRCRNWLFYNDTVLYVIYWYYDKVHWL